MTIDTGHKEVRGDFDPIFNVPIIKAFIGRNQYSFTKEDECSDPLIAMIDTGSYLCWAKKSLIDKCRLELTGNIEKTKIVSLGNINSVSLYHCSLYILGNGIINGVEIAILPDDNNDFDVIIGTKLLSMFDFCYFGKDRYFTLTHR